MTTNLDSYPIGDWPRLASAGHPYAGSLLLPRVYGWTEWARAQLAACPTDAYGQARAAQLAAAIGIAEGRAEEEVGF